MRQNWMVRSSIMAFLVAGLAACDKSPLTAPQQQQPDSASADRGTSTGTTTPATGRPTPSRPEPTRPVTCRPDTGLTQAQIEKIRALHAAFNDEVAEDLRLIAKVEADARAAAQAGAPRERIEAILAEADRAKEHVAEAEERLRKAINDILTDDQRYCLAIAKKR